MNRKHRRDKSARPQVPSHLPQKNKQQNGGDCMEEHAGEMMPARLQPEQLTVEHVRERGQRMPVARVRVRKRPDHIAEAQSSAHDRVLVDVNVIVEVNEIMPKRLPEHDPRDRNQRNATEKRVSPRPVPPPATLRRANFLAQRTPQSPAGKPEPQPSGETTKAIT